MDSNAWIWVGEGVGSMVASDTKVLLHQQGQMTWWIFDRKEEFNMTDISDADLKSRADYVEVTVTSVEQCARYCSLGSACDTFFIDTNLVCTYLPHVALKGFELVDFVNFTKDQGKNMYLLQCSQGNLIRASMLIVLFNIFLHSRFWAILCWTLWPFYSGHF